MTALVSAGESGAAAKGALARLARELELVVMAVKRALPFILRRGGKITCRSPVLTRAPEILGELAAPSFAFTLDARGPGALAFDGSALAMLVDGVLGGDGRAPPVLRASLSAAQRALVARLGESIVRSLSDALSPRLECALTVSSGEATEGALVAVKLDVELGDSVGTLVFGLPLAALAVPPTRVVIPAGAPNADVASMLTDVELDVVVELGRVPIRLGRLASLEVGETFVADLPVGRSVSVLAEGHTLFLGRPTAIGGQFAVKLEKRVG